MDAANKEREAMTPRERAEQVERQIERIILDPDNSLNDKLRKKIDAIEQTIIDAVEEERQLCAQLVDKQVLGIQALIDHAPTKLRREDLKRLKHSLEVAAACIRTRS